MGTTWSMAVNVAGVRPSNPLVFEEIPKGLYVGVVQDSDRKDKDGKTKIQLICALDGHFAGREVHVWINDLEKGFNKGQLRAALLCKGVPENVLDNPQGLNIDQNTFKSVKLNLFIEPREPAADGTKPYPNVNIVAPEHVAAVKASLSSAPAGANGATAAQAAAGVTKAADAMASTINV